MKANRVAGVMMRHALEARRTVDRTMDMFYWPVLDIVVWGFFTIYLRQGNAVAPKVMSFLLSAVILWRLFFAFQRDMAVGFLDELWSRNLINLFSTPLTATEYITGLVLVSFTKTLVALTMAGLVAWGCYAFDVFPMVPQFFPYMVNLVVFGFVTGILITGLIFRFTTKIQTLAWSFAALMQPMSCVLYPVSALPRQLQWVALMLPTTHAFEGMRAILAGHGFSSAHFCWGIALNGVYGVAALSLFRVLFESARSRGLLVKLE